MPHGQKDVNLQSLLAPSLGTVALHVPHFQRDAFLATELRLRSVDCHSSHDGNNSVLLLALVSVEENVKRRSAHTSKSF